MDIKMCERGDYQPAVGTGKRPMRWCREHYLEEHGGEFVRAEVIGELPVTDVRTSAEVEKGGTVELDPEETHVGQLVYAGAIRVLPPEQSSPTTTPATSEPEPAAVKPAARTRG